MVAGSSQWVGLDEQSPGLHRVSRLHPLVLSTGRAMNGMPWRVGPAVVTLLLVLVARESAGQTSVSGAVMGSLQAAASNSKTPGGNGPSVPDDGIGGSTFGIVVSADRALSPSLAAGLELSVSSRFEAEQTASRAQWEHAHRDLILSGILRIRGPELTRWVIGGSFIVEDTISDQASRNFRTGLYESDGPSIESIRRTFGILGGVDFPIPLGSHISLVPQVRVHWIARQGLPHSFLGLSPVVFRPAIGFRVAF